MATTKNYDPGKITLIFKGINVQGVADGTFVKCSRDEDTFKKTSGAQGDVVRVRNRNRMGAVVITLQSTSPTNDLFSAVWASDELTGSGVGSLLIKDLNGTTLVQAAEAWLRKPSDVEFGDEHQPREWTIDCSRLEMLVGGSLV